MPVKAIGADLVEKRFQALKLNLPNLQQTFLTEISSTTRDLLRANTPKDTGNLANSWFELDRTNNSITISIQESGGRTKNSDKLKYIIFGTRPHPIYPVRANALHWIDPDTGRDIFASKVNHPGTQPNNFIASVLFTISLNIESVMRRLMKQSDSYYSNIGFGTSTNFYTRTGITGKSTKTPSIIGGLTILTHRQKGTRKSIGSGRKTYQQRVAVQRGSWGRFNFKGKN